MNTKNYSVMFIEDDDNLLEIYDLFFSKEFKKVYLVNNKKQMDNIFVNYDVDVVFCDLKLKNRFLEFNENGFEIIKYITEKYGNKKSIWIISGVGIINIPPNLRKYIQGFISKPFEKKDIMKVFGK